MDFTCNYMERAYSVIGITNKQKQTNKKKLSY